MKPGPRKRPTRLDDAMGNPGKRKKNKREPKASGSPPAQIDGLEEAGLRKYRQLCDLLRPLGLLARIDTDALLHYAWAWQEFCKCRDFISAHGSVMTIRDARGKAKYIQQLPQVSMARQYWAMMYRLQQEFGMTPAARARVEGPAGAGPVDADTDIEDFRAAQFASDPPSLPAPKER